MLLKIYIPDASAVVVEVAPPLSAIVAALPPAPLIVPEILKVGAGADVKLTAVTSPLFTVTL